MSDPGEAKPTQTGESVHKKFWRGRGFVESSASLEQAVVLLEAVQQDIQALSLFSSNETIEDISTKSLPFLTVEHFLALAMVGLPVRPGQMAERKKLILKSLELWSIFVGRLEQLELLSKEEVKEYQSLMEDVGGDDFMSRPIPPPNRDAKIARFRSKQATKKEVERLKALGERRKRFDIADEDEMDGFDDEGLQRAVALQDLSLQKAEALEQWAQSKQELPMIDMMVKRETEDGKTEILEAQPFLICQPMDDTMTSQPKRKSSQLNLPSLLNKLRRPSKSSSVFSGESSHDPESRDLTSITPNQP